MLDTLTMCVRAVTMNVWSLIIEAFKMLVERDTILSERLAKLEEETGLEITEESVTQSQLQELVGRMQEHLAPPVA
jgi:predicted Holliday junction resolvase-like endonuclease